MKCERRESRVSASAQRDWLAATSNLRPPLLFPPTSLPRSSSPPLPRPLEVLRGFVSFAILPIMFRPAARALARAPTVARGPASTRLISTGPAPKSRSWKNTAVRLGLAAGAVYYYNTSNVFAQEPSCTS